MPSRRMIHPEFWRSESISRLSRDQRLLFLGLVSNADDQGRLQAHPSLIRADVFPYEDEPLDKITADLEAIASEQSVLIYSIDGVSYIQIVNWWKYQRPKWARPSKLPAPEGWIDRVRYRVGNKTVKENWDEIDDDVDDESDGDETIVEPERNRDETTTDSAPKASGSGRDRDSGSGRDSEDGASKPARSPPKSRKSRKKTPTPEAVMVFRENAHRYPPKSWYDDIAQAVGTEQADLDFWGQVVKAYVGMGWNPTNVKGMLDYYGRHEIPDVSKGHAQPTGLAASKQSIARWVEEQTGKKLEVTDD